MRDSIKCQLICVFLLFNKDLGHYSKYNIANGKARAKSTKGWPNITYGYYRRAAPETLII